MDPSKTNANWNKAAGSVKENVGSAIGNKNMQGEGMTQNSSGQAEEMGAKAQGYVSGLMDQAKGAVNGMVDSITGNDTSRAGSKAQELSGEAQKKWNS
ncbi:hypothetical protein J3Q64DRAFT_1069947 [Phycomyces blakesleeanus]|uniref:CsbD-like domain-containing protein n=2 Tax=Phycomyces blakesleeanus TaxID=4837 RepID=A0A163BC07_PHYB8|nr:hypothetical protein PHYBLDRAFT_14326 [Phycomyces blakesleeanus NRRL 1555(-)]OAD79551.1 hypothetical protein PHYBLDRAFT_14326 [Phycomyces blakesleeanus NRRL 1555(-)]|eukprot:XP_018297591.1 hypothetical protein PHYBLDRAFT_14326 [Phycomyces blakesleeanus NRRL 1555(-)]